MSLRTALSHLKIAARGVWFGLTNWRKLWSVYTKAQEDSIFNRSRRLNKDISDCDDCDETGRCEYHRHRTEQLQREIDRELEKIDRGRGES